MSSGAGFRLSTPGRLSGSVGEVDVVLRSSTGQSDIQGLSGLGAGQDHVRRVDREALRRVDGGRVPEPDVLRDVGRGQHDAATQPSPGPGDSEAAVPADVSDAPTIPVLDPVGVADHQAAVVVPGEDDVAGADVGGVGQHGFACGTAGGGEAVSACALVQLGHQLADRRDQQGPASELTVGLPGTVGLLRCCAGVAEVDALVVGVEPDG